MHWDWAGKKPRSSCPGKVNFACGEVKMEVWFSSGQVKVASVVLLVIISNQNQEEQNNELKAWINLKSKHTIDE